MLPSGDTVTLEEYECTEAEALHFSSLFNSVLGHIPGSARDALLTHWQAGCGSPHVWLLENRAEWRGTGWAACFNRGLSLCVVSTLIGTIPDEHMRVAIAHELGHALFLAGGEKHHCPPALTLVEVAAQSAPDPLAFYRCEWLVWRMMEAWGFHQPAMEVWMECNLADDENGIRLRDAPLDVDAVKTKRDSHRAGIEGKLKDMVFPQEFERHLKA